MSQIDLNTAASLAAVAGAVGGAWKVTHALAKWKEATDAHLKEQDKRLDAIEVELKPNHGSSHHDVLVREIRDAVQEVAERDRARRRWF